LITELIPETRTGADMDLHAKGPRVLVPGPVMSGLSTPTLDMLQGPRLAMAGGRIGCLGATEVDAGGWLLITVVVNH
jgi:hypothetical protein